MFEIGYLIMGRPSIFAICFTIWINSFFLIVIFVSVFGNTATNVVVSIMGCTGDACGIWGESYIYMLIIAVALLPTTFMKEIAELHLVSMSLFGAALLFVVINVFQIFFRDHKDYSNVD
jgi:amino acid permease